MICLFPVIIDYYILCLQHASTLDRHSVQSGDQCEHRRQTPGEDHLRGTQPLARHQHSQSSFHTKHPLRHSQSHHSHRQQRHPRGSQDPRQIEGHRPQHCRTNRFSYLCPLQWGTLPVLYRVAQEEEGVQADQQGRGALSVHRDST